MEITSSLTHSAATGRGLRWAAAGMLAGALLLAPQVGAAATPDVPEVGEASVVVKRVEGTLETQKRLLALKDNVFQDEVVETGTGSASEIRFIDNTRISVGPNSKVVLDSFVFDPEPGQGKFVLKVTEGVFRFFSGDLPKTAYNIQTPTLSIGVRGTVLAIVTRANGEVAVILESDDGVTVDSETGESVELDTRGVATVAFIGGGLSEPGPPPAWALWRVHELDQLLASLGLFPETGSGNNFNPPPPPEPPAPPPPASPPPPPVVEDEGKLRGLPRAAQNFGFAEGGELPPGLNLAYQTPQANYHAYEPATVPPGNGPGGASSSGTGPSGPPVSGPSVASNGLAKGMGNGAIHGQGNGASNGVGNNK